MTRRAVFSAAVTGFALAAATASAAAPPPPAPPSAAWETRPVAEIQMLDKVNARHSDAAVKAGDTVTFGTLTIAVQSCVVRPPNQPKDAAAFLTIRDTRPNEPGFSGWMFASNPAVSMLEHPIYDVRVTGCRN